MFASIRIPCVQPLASILLLTATQYAGAQSRPALQLTIVPTSYANKVFLQPVINSSHFHVLLTNTSSAPVNIFEEWNSWGYFGLSFDITYPDGHKVRAGKADRIWDHNFPATTTIAPRGFYVFDVDLSKDWTNFIRAKPKSQAGVQCRIQAIYSIAQDKSAGHVIGPAPAWTGTICSAESAYLVYP